MAVKLPFTADEVIKILDGRYHSPIQEIADGAYTTSARQTIVAGTEYTFENDGSVRNNKILPAHITNIWDTSLNIATFENFLNSPEIVANVSMVFDPSTAAAGTCTIRVYVNSDTPFLYKSTIINYKGSADLLTGLVTFAATEAGLNTKDLGVYFTYEFSGNGEVYDRAIEIYRT